jgi:hypothetical protein
VSEGNSKCENIHNDREEATNSRDIFANIGKEMKLFVPPTEAIIGITSQIHLN